MEGNLLKKDSFTVEYRFAKDLVKAVVDMRTVYKPDSCNIQLDSTLLTAHRLQVSELFSKERPRLDEHVRRFTSRDGRSDYSDERFILCVVQFIDEYNPELKSDVEFVLVCSRIAYVTAVFLRKNNRSDAVAVAVCRVYDLLIDTFYASTINEDGPIVEHFRDRKYRFAYGLVKDLLQMRGVSVPDLELPNADNGLFTSKHKNKVEELFASERTVLDELVKSYTCRDGRLDYSDENLSRCMDKIVEHYGSDQSTEEEFVQVCARIAYAAALFLRANIKAMDLAVDRIYQMVKHSFHFNEYEQDDDYRFSCDLVKTIIEMRCNSLSVAEMSHSCNSFFMIAHRNKIEEFLSREKPNLEKVVRKFTSKDGMSDYTDSQFLLCLEQIKDDYKLAFKSKEEMVHACVKIAYVAACFLRENNKSNAPGLAMDCMLEILMLISLFPNSKDEKVLIMHTQDDHYHFAYDLVRTVLEMKSVPVSHVDLSDPDNFLFTDAHRNQIEDLFSKKSSGHDKVVERLTNGNSDYSDSNFLRCMHEVVKKGQYDLNKEEGLVSIGAILGYLSACFYKENCKSNTAFLAVNRIYEMIKDSNCFSNSTEEQVLIAKAQDDDNYRFAFDLVTAVFDIRDIPVSPKDFPDTGNLLFTDAYRNKIKNMLSKESPQLDEMMVKSTYKEQPLDYSDKQFLHCMNQIAQDYQSYQNTEEEFVYVCARIAYKASGFLIKNCESKATLLAVNRIYEMSKNAFRYKMEEACVKDENYDFAYDLVRAALEIRSNSFKVEMQDPGDSSFTIQQRKEIKEFLSKEWPRLHQIVRRFTKACTDISFSDGHFLHCMQQIINGFEPEQKSEEELLFFSARLAYIAACFLKENQNSNAAEFSLDRIYQMRKKFYRSRNSSMVVKSKVLNVSDDNYRFSYDLVTTVMELQGAPMPREELPNSDNYLFTSQHKKKIKKLFHRESPKINILIKTITDSNRKSDYSDATFQRCMDQIFKVYKYEQVDKAGFVRLCARIAYSASYFVRKNRKSNAATLVLKRVHEMVSNIVYFNKDLEDKRFMDDAEDDKYRFAYDLVKAVVEMHGTSVPHVPLPDTETFLFTAEHKHRLEEFFAKESTQIVDVMKRFTCRDGNLDYSDKSFIGFMDQITKECRYESYTEEAFVLLCGRIAYAASCYFRMMSKSNATALAVNRIHIMVKDIFSRGTLSQSSW